MLGRQSGGALATVWGSIEVRGLPAPCPRLEWPVGHQLRAAPRGGATALPVGGRGQRLWGPLPTEGLSFQSGRGASQLEGPEPAQSQLTLRPTLGR